MFERTVPIISFVELYFEPYFSCDRVNSDYNVNEMFILLVTLQSIWSGNNALFSLSMGNILLFDIQVLSCVIMAAVSSICLINSNICWCTLDEFVTWFCFSGRISSVHFVVNLLFTIVAIVTCSMRRLQIMVWPFPPVPLCSLVLLMLSIFLFINITSSKIEFFFLFFGVEGALTFLNNVVISLVHLLGLVVSALSLSCESNRGDFGWLLREGDLREDSWLRM